MSPRRPVFSLCARRRSPLFAGGTRYASRPARRGGSSSSQKVLRYFLGTLCSGHALHNAHRFHPFREPRCRQIELRGAKARFCLRESFYKEFIKKFFTPFGEPCIIPLTAVGGAAHPAKAVTPRTGGRPFWRLQKRSRWRPRSRCRATRHACTAPRPARRPRTR